MSTKLLQAVRAFAAAFEQALEDEPSAPIESIDLHPRDSAVLRRDHLARAQGVILSSVGNWTTEVVEDRHFPTLQISVREDLSEKACHDIRWALRRAGFPHASVNKRGVLETFPAFDILEIELPLPDLPLDGTDLTARVCRLEQVIKEARDAAACECQGTLKVQRAMSLPDQDCLKGHRGLRQILGEAR